MIKAEEIEFSTKIFIVQDNEGLLSIVKNTEEMNLWLKDGSIQVGFLVIEAVTSNVYTAKNKIELKSTIV